MKIYLLFSILLFNKKSLVDNVSFDAYLLSNLTVKLLQTKEVVVFACNSNGLLRIAMELQHYNQRWQYVELRNKFQLHKILTNNNFARTAAVVDCSCHSSYALLTDASAAHYLNKTYQWILYDEQNVGVEKLLPSTLAYFGPNAQATYINKSLHSFQVWDVHSKGVHLGRSLEIILIAEARVRNGEASHIRILIDMQKIQGINYRDQFGGTTLRGATVIDRDNITTNEQIEEILSRSTKDYGVAAFSKYHYELLLLLRHRLNFTVNFRNARGWASRLGTTNYRLGFLGIIMRNEADIGASAAFNRLNRFAEFDTIHQSWTFQTAFVYRFTADLATHNKNGNFLAAFDYQVWCFSLAAFLVFNFIWRLVEFFNEYHQQNMRLRESEKRTKHNNFQKRHDRCMGKICSNVRTISEISLNTFAAICQQGLDPMPNGFSARTIVLTLYFFSLVMYNYYTSSVVGGLLSSTAQGPATVDEIVSSPLKLSFEDIGYYKVLFRENQSPLVQRLLQRKLLPPRSAVELPVYTHLEDAIPYIKSGSVAFHCEVVDAYPELAKDFDANEICDLRVVSGLMETDTLNWVVSKNSQYTELFRIVMCRAREVGLVGRLLKERRPRKPECQSLYRVYPVSITGVLSAFFVLLAGFIIALQILFVEIIYNKAINKHITSAVNFHKRC